MPIATPSLVAQGWYFGRIRWLFGRVVFKDVIAVQQLVFSLPGFTPHLGVF